MKSLAKHIILAIIALTALSSCTHNNGDIGYWFGLWHLDSIEIDGEPDTAYDGNVYFMFQGKVFNLRWVAHATHDYYDSFAQWQASDDGSSITISFLDDHFLPRLPEPAPDVYLSTVTHLKVLTLNTNSMELSTIHPTTGATVTYHLTIVK